MKVVIPFALPGLNDYVDAERRHRQAGGSFKRKWQNAVFNALRGQIRRPLREPVRLSFLWVEKDRRRDKDNIAAFGRKVIQDALVQMKVLRNDGWQNIAGFTDDFAVDKGRPRIEIEIEEGVE